MHFSSLQNGLYYFTECPLCSEAMKIENIGFKNICCGNDRGYTLVFSLDYDDKLIINPATEEIIIDLVQEMKFDLENYDDSTNVTYHVPKLNISSMIDYNGIMYHPVQISCSRCGNFSYTLKLQINLNSPGRLEETTLANMKVFIKDMNKIHLLTNHYGSRKTFYATNSDSYQKSIELPLIEINLENPQETLARVKKLIIFT